MRTHLACLLILLVSPVLAFAQAKDERTARVAVVNVGRVLDQYEKAQQMKKEVATLKAPFDEPTKRLRDEIARWKKAIESRDFAEGTEGELKAKIDHAAKQIEGLSEAAEREVSKVRDPNLVALWKDLQAAVKTVAIDNDIDLVFGLGEPDEKVIDLFPNVNRNMQAMDMGATVVLHRTPRADITQAVIDVLNQRPREKAKEPFGVDRVAVVNIGQVFNEFKKAWKFKVELEEAIVPFKKKAKELQDEIGLAEVTIKSGLADGEATERLHAKIKRARGDLEDLGRLLQKHLGKKQEANLVTLWTEIKAGIKTCAAASEVEFVLGYGDPPDRSMLEQFPNVNRKMQAMDQGSCMPLTLARRIDLSSEVVTLLNAEQLPAGKKLAPVGISVVNIGYVYSRYDKAQGFKTALEDQERTFNEAAKTLTAKIHKSEEALQTGQLEGKSREEHERFIREGRRDIEDHRVDFQRRVGHQKEEQLAILWKEVRAGNAAVAKAHKLDLLLGYGEPAKDKVEQYANINRKMQALDAGGILPLFVSPRFEVSERVVTTLNQALKSKE